MPLLSPDPQLAPQAFSTSREHAAQGPGGEGGPTPLQGQSTIPALPEAPCLGAQSHTETRFLLNMFLISEERQGGRASISCIHGGC